MTQTYTIQELSKKHRNMIYLYKGSAFLSWAGAKHAGYNIEWEKVGDNKYREVSRERFR